MNPSPSVFQPGIGSVTADNLNTFVQTVASFADLRNFTALNEMVIFLQGGNGQGDGYQGLFYFNITSTATDNGNTVIVPTGSIAGAWLRLTSATAAWRAVATGTTDTATSADRFIVWQSTSTSAKSETIPNPASVLAGTQLTIVDGAGTAATYNITITPVTGLINAASSLVISANYGVSRLVSNGSTAWNIV